MYHVGMLHSYGSFQAICVLVKLVFQWLPDGSFTIVKNRHFWWLPLKYACCRRSHLDWLHFVERVANFTSFRIDSAWQCWFYFRAQKRQAVLLTSSDDQKMQIFVQVRYNYFKNLINAYHITFLNSRSFHFLKKL